MNLMHLRNTFAGTIQHMIISFVVAASENGVIGKDNHLPWRLPADLQFFKKTTFGKPVIMGRKTWESLGSKPLPGRLNIVLSSHYLDLREGMVHCTSIEDALKIAEEANPQEACIIGGGELFKATLPMADNIYFTRVQTVIENGDVFFPELKKTDWKRTWEEPHEADEKNIYPFTFQKWERRKQR